MKQLTKRESEVWKLWRKGLRHKLIGEKLGMNMNTVYVHLFNAKKKMVKHES